MDLGPSTSGLFQVLEVWESSCALILGEESQRDGQIEHVGPCYIHSSL